MGRIKKAIWSKEQIDAYLKDKYPKGLPVTEQEIDIRTRKQREEEAEKIVNKIIDIIEGKEEGDQDGR